MSRPAPVAHSDTSGSNPSPTESLKSFEADGTLVTSPDQEKIKEFDSLNSSIYDVRSAGPLAPADVQTSTPGFALLCLLGIKKRSTLPDQDAIATPESVYDTPHAHHYVPSESWENIAAFDPSFRWTYREQKKLLRKTDLKILLWTMTMWFAVNVIRGNLGNATADNFLKDAGISQSDYNLGLTLQRVGFLAAELPSQIIGKKLGVDIWLPIQLVIFSVLGMAQFAINGPASYICLRFFIALFQGGFVPDCLLYISYYYDKREYPIRLALFWTINSFASIFTGFTSVGLIQMRGVLGYSGWRWMFLIHGLLALLIGIASFFMLAASPSQTKNRLRPNGFFTDKEVKIIVNKIIRDDPGKATMHNRQALTPRLLWKSFKDFDLWPLYIVGLMFGIPAYPISNYLQLSYKQLGFSTVVTNLLSVPYNVLTIIFLLALTVASELFNSRTWVSSVENWWFLIGFIPLVALKTPSAWSYFAMSTFILSYPYAHAIQAAWCSRNAGTVRTRTVAAALYNMAVQTSGIIGANLYQASDAPRYTKANAAILAIIVFNVIIMYPGVWLYYRTRNAHKAKIWDAMSKEQKEHYFATTKDEGARRLDFRFAY